MRGAVRFVQGDVFTVPLPAKGFALVYADPPYAGCRFKYARKNGSRQWGRNARADFMRELIARMEWLRAPEGVCAVSMATPELDLLSLFPSKRRVFAWTKPYAPNRPGVWPTFAWEPVVAWGRFPGKADGIRQNSTPKDWLCLAPKKPRKGEHETPKPEGFAEWVMDLTLGPRGGAVCDLFTGSQVLVNVAAARGLDAWGVDMDDYRPPLLREVSA